MDMNNSRNLAQGHCELLDLRLGVRDNYPHASFVGSDNMTPDEELRRRWQFAQRFDCLEQQCIPWFNCRIESDSLPLHIVAQKKPLPDAKRPVAGTQHTLVTTTKGRLGLGNLGTDC